MRTYRRVAVLCLFCALLLPALSHPVAAAQAGGTSGTVTGTVTDPTGAVVKDAAVTIENPVSEFERSVKTDGAGNFTFVNVPFNPYHLTVRGAGFSFVCRRCGRALGGAGDGAGEADHWFGGNHD